MSKPAPLRPFAAERLEVNPRYLHQNAKMAIRDVYDALIELVTNADDRYQVLGRKEGTIEIEVERKRGGTPSVLLIRDYADGMTLETMREKLQKLGGRVSGMAEGHAVRGTNSRGAKDVAVLGGVTFESIAEDGKYHKCEITKMLEFIPYGPSREAAKSDRESLGLPKGTGTLITLQVESSFPIPRHEQLKENLQRVVALRDIICSPQRRVVLRDLSQEREETIPPIRIQGGDEPRVNERFHIPGYPKAEAKLVVYRASKRFEDEGGTKFRLGGILIKSRHGIHESTYFDGALEHDPHAAWFYGRLSCEYIDELWNEYDERLAKKESGTQTNPCHIVDPMRKQGLRRDHPFTKALFYEALKRFRPLVEEERKRQERERVNIESKETRKRLDALERAAENFMKKHVSEAETAKEPDSKDATSHFLKKGYALTPPFTQILKGHSAKFWLNIRQEAYPELSVGDLVEITCLSPEVSSSHRAAPLETHPRQEGVLRAVWTVRGENTTRASGIQARVGTIAADAVIEVIESEQDKYQDVTTLSFSRKRYTVIVGGKRMIQILAPCPAKTTEPIPFEIAISDNAFRLVGAKVLTPHPDIGIAMSRLHVSTEKPDLRAKIEAKCRGETATAEVHSIPPHGSPIKIQIVPEDFGSQRSRWQANILQIAAKHPAVRRYLGPAPQFAGQEEKHFRLLVAEIAAEAVCQRILSRNETDSPEEFHDFDWEAYFVEYSKLMAEFLPIAHESQVKEP